MGIQSSILGTTAQFAPVMKRASGEMSTGETVFMVPDANLAGFAGDDATGVAKIRFYKVNAARTTVTLSFTWTPSPAPCSSSKAAVCSMVVDTSNNIHVVWQGTDNSLWYNIMSYSAGVWTPGTSQNIKIANAVTNRFRALDIDWTNSGLAVMAYESLASTGQNANVTLYCRLSDGTTWRRAFQVNAISTGAFIRQGSEDVSVSFNTAGIVSNVAKILIFYTRTSTTSDSGDLVKEISFNFATGIDDSGVTLGTWPTFNQNYAAGSRRGWIFKTTSNIWQVAMSAGLAQSKFMVMRLTSGAYGPPIINSNSFWVYANKLYLSKLPRIDVTANAMTAISCVYNDDKVMFGFITDAGATYGPAAGKPNLASIIFRYDNSSEYSASYHDNQMRPLDEYFLYGERPVAIYGGGNSRTQSSDYKFDWIAWYGYAGNSAISTKQNKAYFVYNTFYDPPVLVAPTTSAIQPNNSPTLQVRVQNGRLYPQVRGKIQWTLAKDAGFTVQTKTITEPDANFRYFGSTTNEVPPPVSVAHTLAGTEKLNSGTWYMRARVVDDLGGSSAWSSVQSFVVQHPPAANPASPSSGSLIEFGLGSVTFSWTFTDTEPGDSQSAYQVLITRQDTGATVLDTGKVVSSANSTTQTISDTLKDIPLQWSVKLWDTDDVAGSFSNPVLFTLSDAPAVVVTSPTNGATVTTARPTVTWNPTISGSRLQKAYRVYAFSPHVADLFDRVTSNGLGTSSNGRIWTVMNGDPVAFSADGTSAHIVATLTEPTDYSVVHDFISVDSLQSMEFTPPAIATGDAYAIYLSARYLDESNYYRARFRFLTDGTMTMRFQKRVGGGSIVSLGSGDTLFGAYAAGVKYKLIFEVSGSTFRIKAHAVSAGEPAAWHIIMTDTSLAGAGKGGVRALRTAANTNTGLNYAFDNYAHSDAIRVIVGESGWVQGTENSFTFSSNIFEDLKQYAVQVYVQDTGGLLGGASSLLKTDWIESALGDVSVTTDDFGATVSWTNTNIDTDFVAWRVYRKYMVPDILELDDENTANTWVLVYETDEVKSNYSYKDYLAPLNKSISYAVVQVVDRFGSLIESVISSSVSTSLTGDRYFFVPEVPIGSIASYEAAYVTGDNFTDEVEQETLHVKGRGRQVQVGDDLGISGTLTIHLRNPDNARADRQFIQRLSKAKTGVYIKTPFGDVHLVKFENVGVTRIPGVGLSDLVDLSVPYTEVFDRLPITRAS